MNSATCRAMLLVLSIDILSLSFLIDDIVLLQDGFKDDSLRIMKDIERVNANCQVC